MFKPRERKKRRALISRSIISPSESENVLLFLVGAIVGGITFGFGFALGQQMLNRLEHKKT